MGYTIAAHGKRMCFRWAANGASREAVVLARK
jgi:hypothetical protein